MTKTIEQTLRDKFATGYDPITLAVSAKGINQENLDVVIEGLKYSVAGNTFSHIEVPSSREPEQPAADVGAGSGADAVVEQGSPDGSTLQQTRLDAVTVYFGAATYELDGTDALGGANYNFVNANGDIVFQGTLLSAEDAVAEHQAKLKTDQAQA